MAPQQYFAFNVGPMDIFPLRVDQGGLSVAQKWPALVLLMATVALLVFVVLIVWGVAKMRSETHTERRSSEVPCAPTTRTPLLALHGKGLRYMQKPCTSLTAGEESINADLEWDSFLMQE